MEKSPETKKESGVNRIIGTEETTEKELLLFFKSKFEAAQKDNAEIEHSAELDELIGLINNRFEDFLKEYGIASINIPSTNFHVIDEEKLTSKQLETIKQFKEQKIQGFYLPHSQHIGLLVKYENDKKLAFLQMLVHEMLHLNSFLSFQKLSADPEDGLQLTKESASGEAKEEISLGVRRMGFRVKAKDGKTYFYDDVDEAIITELEMRFDWKYFSQFPELEPELKKRQEAIEAESRRSGKAADELKRRFAYLEEWREENENVGWIIVGLNSYSYDKERGALNELIDEIYKKNKSDFLSREAVFIVFAKATMTGRLLPVARLIEKTFGRGSFRALGEKFSRQPAE